MDTHIKEFFTALNNETSCLFYTINMRVDGEVHIRWKNLTHLDYHIPPPDIYNKINIRMQKVKDKMFLLDFYQYYKGKMEWMGVRFKSCVGYEVVMVEEDDKLTITFRFCLMNEEKEQTKIIVRGISMEIVFLLQQFLISFM